MAFFYTSSGDGYREKERERDKEREREREGCMRIQRK